MTRRAWPKAAEPVHRSVFVPDFIIHLRLMLGLPPTEPAPGEGAATRGFTLPTVADALDLGAWLAWALAGLPLFVCKPLPSMEETVATARRVVLGLAVERTGGNVTHAAKLLQVSRLTVRHYLRWVARSGMPPSRDPTATTTAVD
jgi:hypothetical protein